MKRSAEDIKKEVVDQLFWDSRIDSSDIVVKVEDGIVILEGSTSSYFALMAASETVRMVNGVKSVKNNLRVKHPDDSTLPKDNDLEKGIENKILWDSQISSAKISVKVEDNSVTLDGTTDSYWKKYRAGRMADIKGVVSVENNISVVPTKDIVDEDIALEITKAIERKVNIDNDAVTVKVRDGIVTLTGKVPNWNAYRSTENIAFYTYGVREVHNELSIK